MYCHACSLMKKKKNKLKNKRNTYYYRPAFSDSIRIERCGIMSLRSSEKCARNCLTCKHRRKKKLIFAFFRWVFDTFTRNN